jgi:hypothetical protein
MRKLLPSVVEVEIYRECVEEAMPEFPDSRSDKLCCSSFRPWGCPNKYNHLL